ncbi:MULTISPECIES: UdgX family uracil-DNA binding protein [unclassified Bradyrhizobium]|uniref:UdgX family uracil-DNA binding protein n=1 Tax=unclassified Bradyrhizobium TaxID=2631580 RepID=UPI0024796D48|nr:MULTISPECIES: UdgX family uracil-DNA binding protein [unclassified Bradyrhizobium]WGR69017.1 UdgX family uracil-DNA binding protein [Bradyrhizobium sp. ISRA426]WGR81072.1 UdgX family uracil-DNA binding protein [Bradyrhizobium sp. ISRA430]WGR84256.1 UdgX family uracil-DNA binding protein [Bradyrhizobium sp. ISRA432]
MYLITLDSETDFDGWRKTARALALHHVAPAEVTWSVQGRTKDEMPPGLCEAPGLPPIETDSTFSVPANFIELARVAILHHNSERFALLYRLLWRLRSDHDLLETRTDPDVAIATAMAGSVHRDVQRMRDVVRFREIGREHKTHFAAWFVPEHHIVEFAAPFFARRYADMPWSILTPDICAHWDGHAISFTPGISQTEMPAPNRLEETWRRHFRSDQPIAPEAPKKRRRNLSEASILEPLLSDAERWTGGRITPPSEPSMKRKSAADDLETLRDEAAHCRACHLYKDATQTVFGEGPKSATIMLVGEQPGDKEDLAGHPFVGPAGQILDRALEEAGVDRKKVYVTNAVKHFKFVPRGKIRLHQKPNTPEIRACRQWYERELAALQPSLVVAMGATAAQSVFGKITPIGKNRGRLIELPDGRKALVTVHPSYLLRLPDPEAKEQEYRRFVGDLRLAAGFREKSARAA